MRILLVEDEIDGQEVVATILEMNGLDVDIVGDGVAALSQLESTSYDVAIVDIALPELDGWGLIEEIKSRDNLSNMYCIAITAYHDSSVRQRANDVGFDDYLPKPVNAEHLVRSLDKFSSQ